MNPAQLASWRRRLDHVLCDPRPCPEALYALFGEMALALVACKEREEEMIAELARRPRVLFAVEPDLRYLVGVEEREARRRVSRSTLPTEGIESLLRRKMG